MSSGPWPVVLPLPPTPAWLSAATVSPLYCSSPTDKELGPLLPCPSLACQSTGGLRVLWPSPLCCLERGRELPRSPSKGVVELDVPPVRLFPPPTLALVLSLRPWMQDALGLTCLAPWVRA